MAVFCHKTSIDKLRKRMPEMKNAGFGYGLGGNDVTSRPQTINQQPKAKNMNSPMPQSSVPRDSSPQAHAASPIQAPEQSADASMSKNEINLSEQQLLKMLEEA